LIKRIPPPTPKATKTLVIAHREELLLQAANQIARFAPDLRVAIDQGSKTADPSMADVIVASVPTLGRKGSTRLDKYDPEEFKCIIIDEAHHAAASSYARILEHFGAVKVAENEEEKLREEINNAMEEMEEGEEETVAEEGEMEEEEVEEDAEEDDEEIYASEEDDVYTTTLAYEIPDDVPLNIPKLYNPNIFVWGCSATVRRHDRVRLDTAFDYITYHKNFIEMIYERWQVWQNSIAIMITDTYCF
jgi:hypothetical protein